MEDVIIDYIQKMFGSVRPTWSAEYEGFLFYDINNHVLVGGDDVGWVEIISLED